VDISLAERKLWQTIDIVFSKKRRIILADRRIKESQAQQDRLSYFQRMYNMVYTGIAGGINESKLTYFHLLENKSL
jgi:hypothetical protein